MISKASAVNLRPEQPQITLSRPSSPELPESNSRNHSSSQDPPSTRNKLSLKLERSPLLPPIAHAHDYDHLLSSVSVDRPSTPSIRVRDYLSHPHTSTELEFAHELPLTPGGSPSFFSQARGGPLPEPTLRSRLRLLMSQTWTNALSAFFLLVIVFWALASRALNAFPSCLLPWRQRKGFKREWDHPGRYKERLVKDPSHYAQACGYRIVHQTVETEDGYFLKVHKVQVPGREGRLKANGRGGWPVIIQHGLFQTSGSFVTSEERSLAFWLAEHGGYQVYLSNNRAVFDMGHRVLKRSDPRFWDYNIRELALYDLPAIVEHVKKETGYDKVAFIGHSQGNATMFCTLARGMKPDLGHSLSIFIALAPAVYAGPLTTGFPFNLIKSMDWKTWKRLFGVLDFIPIMRWAYNLMPGYAFGLLGYQMFAFLFDWTDKNWVCFFLRTSRFPFLTGLELKRRKPKMFRFTPSPVSSAAIFWWTGLNGFSARGCVLDDKVRQCGGKDYLVLVDPLLARLKNQEQDVRVMRVDKLETGEHCDTFWHVDAVELCYHKILEDIEKTRDCYPEEANGIILYAGTATTEKCEVYDGETKASI